MSNASSGLCINLVIYIIIYYIMLYYIILYYAGPLFRILGCNEVGMPPSLWTSEAIAFSLIRVKYITIGDTKHHKSVNIQRTTSPF